MKQGLKQGLLIGELGRLFNIPTQTIRYYERLGIIDPPSRTEAQYRIYSEEDVNRLQFILQAKRFGLSLDEIKELIELHSEGTPLCDRLKELLKKHLEKLDAQIQALMDFRNELSQRYETLEKVDFNDLSEGTICKYIEQEPIH